MGTEKAGEEAGGWCDAMREGEGTSRLSAPSIIYVEHGAAPPRKQHGSNFRLRRSRLYACSASQLSRVRFSTGVIYRPTGRCSRDRLNAACLLLFAEEPKPEPKFTEAGSKPRAKSEERGPGTSRKAFAKLNPVLYACRSSISPNHHNQ